MLEDRKIPNSIISLALTSAEEILGKKGVNSLLSASGLNNFRDNYPPNNSEYESNAADFSALVKGMIDIIGHRGANEIMRTVGQQGFKNVLEKSPELFDLTEIDFKKMYTDDEKITALMSTITRKANEIFGEGHQEFKRTNDGYEIRINRCSWCYAIEHTRSPVCFGEEGFNDEAIFWATGKRYSVVETECRAMGHDACVFMITKKAD